MAEDQKSFGWAIAFGGFLSVADWWFGRGTGSSEIVLLMFAVGLLAAIWTRLELISRDLRAGGATRPPGVG
jgi:hypothetical protein